PVWAIGTGEVATPDDAQEVCAAIRDALRAMYGDTVADAVRVLYGGSVKSSNVVELMGKADVDGALVGGASLQAEEFAKIVGYQGRETYREGRAVGEQPREDSLFDNVGSQRT